MSPSLQLPFIVEIEGGGCDVFVLGLLVVALALVALLLAVRHPVRTILSVGESKFPDFPTRPHTNRISGWKAAIAFLIGFVVISTVTLCHRNAFKSPSDLSKEHSDLSSNNRVDPLPEMSKDFSAKRTASTANFRIEFRNWQQARVVDGHDAPQILAPVPIVSRGDREPSLFVLAAYHKSSAKKAMWTSIPGRPFLQSAIGNDSLTPGNGEYRIVQSNRQLTNYQTIVDVRELAPGEGSDALRSHDRVIVQGQLLYTARPDKDEPKAVINYTATFYEKTALQLGFRVELVDVIATDHTSYDRVMLVFAADSNEEVFGLGEQFSFWSLRGQRVPIVSREQGIGRGLQPLTFILNHVPPAKPAYSGGDTLTTYTAIPHYVTSHGRSLLLANTELSFFDFRAANQTTIEVVSRNLELVMFYSERPLALLNEYTRTHSGRMRALPAWASSGAVVGVQGGEERVLSVIEKLRAWNVPVAAVWLQDWVGLRAQSVDTVIPIPSMGRGNASITITMTAEQKRLWWNWEYDRQAYPNWPAFIRRLRKDYGIRVLTYINPFLTDVESAGKPAGSWTRNYFREAAEQGFLVKRWARVMDGDKLNTTWHLVDALISSGPGLVAGMIDLSNPRAFEWYKNVIKENMVKLGVSGWMADFGEYLPFDSVPFSMQHLPGPSQGSPASNPLHNLYPLEWARLNREAVEEMGRETSRDVVFFSRSAAVASPGAAHCFWTGDQLHTWDHLDGLESTVGLYASLSASLSGMALLHSDIGGYTTVNTNPNVTVRIGNRSKSVYLSIIDKRIRFVRQDRELYMRWMETAAFSSTGLMRTHEGSVPVENLQPWSDERLARVFAYFTKTFTALEPYRRLLMIEHQRRGYPILRPLLLHYPHGNRAAIDMERLQYMLGPLVLVVPVTSPELRYLNQKIVDGKGEEEQDDVGDDSDEGYDERVNGDQDMHVPHNGRKIKASVLATMYEWSSTIASTAAQLVLAQARPSNADAVFHMDDDEERVAPSITRTLLRFLLGRRGDMDAKDSDLPQPHHGRPYLPPGTWIHVWSGQRFTVTNDRGLFLEANNSNHRLACPLGQPGVFIRDISESEMREMLVRGMAGEPVLGGEDWRYWLDGRVDGSASTEEDGSNGSDEIRDRDEGANALADPIAYAMRRCRRFRRGLTSFLTHIENVPFPGDSDGEI